MKRTKILFCAVLILLVAAGSVFAGGGQAATSGAAAANPNNLPRNETLYYNGLQWGAVAGFNPYMANANNALVVAGHRQLFFETLFIFNMLDGKLYPQLGTSYSWNGQVLTVQLNPNARWANGTPVTAADVVYTFELGKTYAGGLQSNWDFLDSVRAQGNNTVIFTAKASNFNPKQLETFISETFITPRAYWESKIASGELGRSEGALLTFAAMDIYGSGPYQRFFEDETKVILIRNDNYWGQHASHRGKLPVPRYIAHNIYADNAAGDAAFLRGEVDVSQQFMDSIWNYIDRGARTYIPGAPYYLPGSIPMIVFNLQKPGLDDYAVRRALAMVIDYNAIGVNAMSGYTAPKEHHLMLPIQAERDLVDMAALAPYQWQTMDIAGANALLDQAGWVRGADGIRAKGGVRLSFRLTCPFGWSDWNASLEIVAQNGRAIGMDLTTYFPEQPVWERDRNYGDFDITMMWTSGPGAASPWNRMYTDLSSTHVPSDRSLPITVGNYGRYHNAEVNDIISKIPSETNEAALKQLWTRLNIIYLQELPFIGLMYRPWVFHQVNQTVWTGFPTLGDGTNVPPQILCDGYGIVGLYNIRLR